MNVELGGYHIGDIELASAFDINKTKVGRDVADAVFAEPNNAHRFAAPKPTGIKVRRGPTLDGLGTYLRGRVEEASSDPIDVRRALRESGTEIVVSYLPVGSQKATEFYAEQALEAGCAFVNCIPVFIASAPKWRGRFAERRLPIIGDDIKRQVGATIQHRVLANLINERGDQFVRINLHQVGVS